MTVLAIQQIRKMRGGAQSHLMLGADGHAWVVKFQNNPQHLRVLPNELLGTRLAGLMGLTVPQCDVVEVTPWLIEQTSELKMELGDRRERCVAGLQFGSRMVGGLMPGHVADYLPEEQLLEVKNLGEFAGALVLDKWTCNANGRQALFYRKGREKRYSATFIDQGFCFNAAEWRFEDAPLRGVYARNAVYREVTGWESFEPWLSRHGADRGAAHLGNCGDGAARVVRKRSGGSGAAGGEADGAASGSARQDYGVSGIVAGAISKVGGEGSGRGKEGACGDGMGR